MRIGSSMLTSLRVAVTGSLSTKSSRKWLSSLYCRSVPSYMLKGIPLWTITLSSNYRATSDAASLFVFLSWLRLTTIGWAAFNSNVLSFARRFRSIPPGIWPLPSIIYIIILILLDICPVMRAGVSLSRFEIDTLPILSDKSFFSQRQNPVISSSGILDLLWTSISTFLPKSFWISS